MPNQRRWWLVDTKVQWPAMWHAFWAWVNYPHVNPNDDYGVYIHASYADKSLPITKEDIQL